MSKYIKRKEHVWGKSQYKKKKTLTTGPASLKSCTSSSRYSLHGTPFLTQEHQPSPGPWTDEAAFASSFTPSVYLNNILPEVSITTRSMVSSADTPGSLLSAVTVRGQTCVLKVSYTEEKAGEGLRTCCKLGGVYKSNQRVRHYRRLTAIG